MRTTLLGSRHLLLLFLLLLWVNVGSISGEVGALFFLTTFSLFFQQLGSKTVAL